MCEYEGIRLDTDNPTKLIPFIDNYCSGSASKGTCPDSLPHARTEVSWRSLGAATGPGNFCVTA